MPASLAAYRLATGAAEPFAPLVLNARVKRGKEDPARLSERLARNLMPRPAGRLAWLHGASVGEALSLLPLASSLAEARDDLTLLVTAGTRTAAELLARRLPPRAIHQYAPIDAPGPARRFLDHWRPDLGVFVESELWPNLLGQARRRRLRMALLSAKLSDRSLRDWSRLRGAAQSLLGAFELILAQDQTAAARFESLGVKVQGLADLKFGAPPLPADPAALYALRGAIGKRPVLLAASTHPGEDEIVLDAFAALASVARKPLLAIVPRHPERGPAIAALAAARGLTVSRQGAGEPMGGQAVRIADGLGELGLWFRLARLAIIGGSLVDGIGGHNPLEPARLDCPMISGPYVANWKSAYAGLTDAGGAAVIAPDALHDWLGAGAEAHPDLSVMAGRAKAFVAQRDADAGALTAQLLAMLP